MARHLDFQILKSGDRLLVSAEDRAPAQPEGAVTALESLDVDWAEVEELAQEVARLLTSQHQARGVRARLERAGQLLFDLTLGPRVKEAIRKSQAPTLSLSLHAELLALPWELLHDGADFLCLRFAMGRLVQAEDEAPDAPAPFPEGPLRLLIVADPRGDLPHADEEGQQLLELAFDEGEGVEPDLLAAPTTRRRVLESFRAYHALHIAGHGEAGQWLMKDGTLSAGDIVRMRGSGRFPALVFANACVSGAVVRWDPGAEEMARGFLLGGSRHFIGAICALPDRTGQVMAVTFYRALFKGVGVGRALLAGRAQLAEARDLPPLAWAGYVLYGDPRVAYLGRPDAAAERPTPEGIPRREVEGEARLIIPQGDERPSSPKAAPPAASSGPRWPWGRIALGAALGVALSLMSSLETLKVLPFLDTVWMASVQRLGGGGRMGSPLVLLGVSGGEPAPRRLYARLLEALTAHPGPSPGVVAFDTWFKALPPDTTPGEDERRLTAALAGALERFPVVIGQRWDMDKREAVPPPPWLRAGVEEGLRARALARCADPECVVPSPPPFLERLSFGHVAVSRVAEGIFWDLDQRIPFGCEGDGIPFSWRVAFPRSLQQPICRQGGASFGVTGEGGIIPLDPQGRMLLRYTQTAEWGPGAADFPAFDLATLVDAWAAGEGDVTPGDLGERILLVGLAQGTASASDADRRQTPIGEMYGVEVQANAIEELRQRTVPHPVGALWALIFGGAMGALGGLVARRWVTLVALGTLLGVGTYLLWAGPAIVLFPGASLLTLMVMGLLGRREGGTHT